MFQCRFICRSTVIFFKKCTPKYLDDCLIWVICIRADALYENGLQETRLGIYNSWHGL